MLNIHPSASGNAAKHYFFSGLVHGDYYTEGQERVGRWWGHAAEFLGLSGNVQTRDFCRLVDNVHPSTEEQLTVRMSPDRRPGYDLTFCPCKSFSIVGLVLREERFLPMLEAAVEDTLAEIQASICTRVRKDGEDCDRFTGNMVSALFPHLTARPEKGQLPDPLMHVHAYTPNVTFDPVEATWKAVQFGLAKSMGRYFEAYFHNNLAHRVMDAGYKVEPRGDYWEIVGVPESAIRLFSKRGQEVERVAQERGIDDPAEKAEVASRTRRGKAPEHSLDELRKGWWSQLSTADAKALSDLKPGRPAVDLRSPAEIQRDALQLVKSVSSSLFERSSTIAEHRLVEACMRRSPGRFQPEHFREVMKEASLIVRDLEGARWVTHRDVYREERSIVAAVQRGKGKFLPVGADRTPPQEFTKDQKRAFKHILSSRDRVTLIEGGPGTGKTSLARETSRVLMGVLRQSLSPVLGDKVVVLAPTAFASRDVLRSEGFKNATTVASFLFDEKVQSLAKKGWIWLDEAGQLGTSDAKRVLELAEELQARVVVACDRGQNRAVSRGDFPGILIEHAGVQSCRMAENIRQHGKLKEVASAFVAGEIAQGFGSLAQNRMLNVAPAEQCYQLAAREFAQKFSQGSKVAAVTPTHEEAARVTGHIRQELIEAKKLGKHSREHIQYIPRQLTDEEKRDVQQYSAGQMVKFHQNTKGFELGKPYTVVGPDPFGTHVLVRGKSEVVEALPFKHSANWVVHDTSTIDVRAGEMVRVTRNTKVHTSVSRARAFVVDTLDLPEKGVTRPKTELANSSVHRVTGWTLGGDIVLDGNRIFPKDHGHLDYGYVRTGHGLQGGSFDSMVVVATQNHLGPVNRGNFVTMVTRAVRDLKVFTDDAEKLQQAANRVDRSPGALDVVDKGTDPAFRDERAAKDHSNIAEYRDWARQQEKEKERGFER